MKERIILIYIHARVTIHSLMSKPKVITIICQQLKLIYTHTTEIVS